MQCTDKRAKRERIVRSLSWHLNINFVKGDYSCAISFLCLPSLFLLIPSYFLEVRLPSHRQVFDWNPSGHQQQMFTIVSNIYSCVWFHHTMLSPFKYWNRVNNEREKFDNNSCSSTMIRNLKQKKLRKKISSSLFFQVYNYRLVTLNVFFYWEYFKTHTLATH